MGIFDIFKSKTKNVNEKDYTREIANIIGCDYAEISGDYKKELIFNLYVSELKKGQEEGYTPVITAAGSTLHEIIELNSEEYPAFEDYRTVILNNSFDNGIDVLNERFRELEQNMAEAEDYDIYGEYTGKINPCNYFLSIDKSDLNSDETLVLFRIPVKEPWKVFAWIPFGGWNECPDPVDMIAVCKYWYEKFGAFPAIIKSDILEMYVPEPVNNIETAFDVAKEQYGFCNDTVDQGTGTIKSLAETLVDSKIWCFWWD